MFLKTKTIESTSNYYSKIDQLKQVLNKADAIVIGAGSGLSTSAGFTYSGERFEKYFGDFIRKYGFEDMYSGGFYPFDSLEEYWSYWSRYIYINRYMNPPKPVYENLLKIVKDKDYFVLTTNVDHCFQKVGFDKDRLFYTQGDYGLWQCSKACHHKTYDNEKAIKKMIEIQKNMRIPNEFIPHCPVCGALMSMNLRIDNTFVEDEGWHKAAKKYQSFLHKNQASHVLFLELGVGENTPVIIKYPFWQMTYDNPKATYVCINYKESIVPKEIENRSICINEDIGKVLMELQMK